MMQWMQHLLRHSAAMAALVLAYCAATVLLKKRYAARQLYLVGGILLLGFLIPLRPILTIEPQRVPAFIQGIASQNIALPPDPAEALSPAGSSILGAPWHIAFLVWAVGALFTLLRHGVRHIRFVRAVKRWSVEVDEPAILAQLASAKQALSLQGRHIGLARCACVCSPMLLWLGKPMVLLPESMASGDHLRFILLHELLHHKRRDLLCRLLMLFCTAMHWFNPAIYLLTWLVTQQCEVSCDERVVENQTIETRHRYAMSMIGVARHQAKGYTLLTTNFSGGKNTMKKRITSIYAPAKKKSGILLLVCTLLLTLLAGSSIAANTGTEIAPTLPDAAIKSSETVDAYVVTWEPLEGMKNYLLGVYFKMQEADGQAYYAVAEGYMPKDALLVVDDQGEEYAVENMVMESLILDGDAAEADIGYLLNMHIDPERFENATLTEAYLTVLATRESGPPIQMTIDIPVE